MNSSEISGYLKKESNKGNKDSKNNLNTMNNSVLLEESNYDLYKKYSNPNKIKNISSRLEKNNNKIKDITKNKDSE